MTTDRRAYFRALNARRLADPDYRRRNRERAYLHVMGRPRPAMDADLRRRPWTEHFADDALCCATCGEPWPCVAGRKELTRGPIRRSVTDVNTTQRHGDTRCST